MNGIIVMTNLICPSNVSSPPPVSCSSTNHSKYFVSNGLGSNAPTSFRLRHRKWF